MSPDDLRRDQKRALFFVFDGGTGVGHLRRLAAIARQLQGPISCLIVTGHRAAAHWFVPEACEYVHLPSWDSLLAERAAYWGRRPFLDVDKPGAVRLRRQMIDGIVRAFDPQMIFVEHLPLGAEQELAELIERAPCRRYLVTRGVQNETEDLARLVFGGRAEAALRDCYDRILVGADPRIFDLTAQYRFAPEIARKVRHMGYITTPVAPARVAAARLDRGLGTNEIWVVASAGGGQKGEPLVCACLALAAAHPAIAFDIVLGPRSNVPWEEACAAASGLPRLRLHRETADMPVLHAAADIVISSAGYNSLLEALQGRATLLCFPIRRDRRDEQHSHAERLRQFVNLELSLDPDDLPAMFADKLAALAAGPVSDRRGELDFGGAEAIRRLVLDDCWPRPGLDRAGAIVEGVARW